MKEGVAKVYSYRQKFLVIGLTGRTGSGCTSASDFLSMNLDESRFPKLDSFKFDHSNDRRKTEIVFKYAKVNWSPFFKIRVKDIITAFILEVTFDDFIKYLKEGELVLSTKSFDELNKLRPDYDKYHQKRLEIKKIEEKGGLDDKIEDAFNFHFSEIHKFTERLKSILKFDSNGYTKVYQTIGDNIRSYGQALPKEEFDVNNTDSLVRKVNKFIKLLRKKSEKDEIPAFIVIDALRNPFEIFFLKERYSSFYTISINSEDEDRKTRLRSQGLSDSEIEELDNKEYPKKLKDKDLYISQNIQKCIELADIHIHNIQGVNENFNSLKKQLVWYYALMIKPGIVPPTPIERIMQLAYSAKLNSGCLSRQVGATITDSDFSVKAIGWNNVPKNQVPCILRNCNHLIESRDIEAYSEYELNDEKFRKVFTNTFNTNVLKEFEEEGNNASYCFKEVQNKLEKEKNQVHTRSLHAEENAFLQLTKYGSSGIENGILFTTASPCELCSKKAYQLGIRKIFYIDPYPGIATKHILKAGTSNPELKLFNGVVGRAYFNLYQPLLTYKDEMKQFVQYSFSSTPSKEEELIKKIEELEEQVKYLKSLNENT